MSDSPKASVENKKVDALNNELSADVKPAAHEVVIPIKESKEEKTDVPKVTDFTITNSEFSVAIVKAVTGTGCLSIPASVLNMGIIPTMVVFLLVTYANVINTKYLIDANEGLKKRKLQVRNGMVIENDYANLMYQLYGMQGYYVFLVFFYMTVWSVMLGTMIGMFDFIKQLPYPEDFLGGKTSRDLILHIVSTLLCYVLCCIRNTKQLFFVSWFGIFTLVLSYVVVLVYGLATIKVQFDPSILWAHDIRSFFSSIGVAPYSLGYNFCFLTYYKQVVKTQVPKTFGVTVKSIFAVCIVYLAFAIPSTVVYASIRDAEGNFTIKSNIVSNMPSSSGWAVLINLLMWLSCMCSEPVLLSSTNELLEKNCPVKSNSFLVNEPKRLWVRLAQIAGLSFISYVLPFFGSIVNLFGGFAFVATSILIPVIIHYSVYRSTMRTKEKMVHLFWGLAAFLLMVVATFFSVLKLISDIVSN